MKTHSFFVLVLAVLLLESCHSKKNAAHGSNSNDSSIDTPNDTLSTLDSTIFLTNISLSHYKGAELTDSLAKRVLYDHFTKKGYFTQKTLPATGVIKGADTAKLEVDFTALFLVDINNNDHTDGVITYWVAPPYGSSHCYQPHKAIITDTDNGYKISNEEFILPNFDIDSIKKVNDQLMIFGVDYQCANHEVLRNLRIRLSK